MTQTFEDAALAEGLALWLAHTRGVDVVAVDHLERPPVGYSSSTVLFQARWEGTRPVTEDLVLRMAPEGPGIHIDYDLRVEHAAQETAADAGVPIASPLELETDPRWLGAPFLLMPRVEGHIIGETPAFDPWLTSLGLKKRGALHEYFLDALRSIHEAPVDRAIAGGVPVRDDRAELDHWDRYLDWAFDGSPLPALSDALAWCAAHAPDPDPDAPLVLCWGDVRLGNVVLDDHFRPRAVLDWDMTVIGRREHDIAWYTALTETIATIAGARVAGFPDRDTTIRRYERLSSHTVRDLDWYETLAMVRSTAIMTRINTLAIRAGREPTMPIDDNPLLDLLCARTTGS